MMTLVSSTLNVCFVLRSLPKRPPSACKFSMSPLLAPSTRPMYVITRKMAKLKNERVLSGIVVCVKIREAQIGAENAQIEPIAAPISRRRLALRSRTSNKITAIANRNPASAAISLERLNGRKW